MNAMKRYQVLSSFDRAKIKAELGEDYKNLKEVHEAQSRAFEALSEAEQSSDLEETERALRGRPQKEPGIARVKKCFSIRKITLGLIDAISKKTGENRGEILDRLVAEASLKE